MTRNSDVRELVEAALDLARIESQTKWHSILISSAYASENINDKIMERYDEGSEEHDHDWLNWGHELFDKNYKEEIYDMILYTAMNIVRREMARKYGGNSSTSYNEARLLSCEESKTDIDGVG